MVFGDGLGFVDAHETGDIRLSSPQAREFFAEAIGSVVKALIASGALTPEAAEEAALHLWQTFGGDDSHLRNEVGRLTAAIFPTASITSKYRK